MRIPSEPESPPPSDAPVGEAKPIPEGLYDPPPLTGPERIAWVLGWVNVMYLGVLPAVATWGVFRLYGLPFAAPMVLFGGLIAVVVYLGIVLNVAPAPASPWTALWILLDGPFFALLAGPRSFAGFAIQAFFVDGLALWIGVAALWFGIARSDGAESLFGCTTWLIVAGLAGMFAPFWPYLHHDVLGHWTSLVVLLVGVAGATWSHLRALGGDGAGRDTSGFGAAMWMIAMVAGLGLHSHHG